MMDWLTKISKGLSESRPTMGASASSITGEERLSGLTPMAVHYSTTSVQLCADRRSLVYLWMNGEIKCLCSWQIMTLWPIRCAIVIHVNLSVFWGRPLEKWKKKTKRSFLFSTNSTLECLKCQESIPVYSKFSGGSMSPDPIPSVDVHASNQWRAPPHTKYLDPPQTPTLPDDGVNVVMLKMSAPPEARPEEVASIRYHRKLLVV